MTLPELDNLDVYRKRLQKAKEQLKIADDYFKSLTTKEKDMTKKTILILLSEYSVPMRDLYSQIELWAIEQSAVKSKINILRDILVQLPEVKNNGQLMNNIEKLFNQQHTFF